MHHFSQRTKLSLSRFFWTWRERTTSLSQSEREGERTDLPLAGLEKVKGSLSLSLLSCLCLCLCLCLCFFFFFLCSWWWWWWWSLCLEDADSLANTESGAVATGCMLISKGDCSLPWILKTQKWIPVGNKEKWNWSRKQLLTVCNPGFLHVCHFHYKCEKYVNKTSS